jgi:hypothetical protein
VVVAAPSSSGLQEVVAGPTPRAGDERVAAGAKRARGGAIVVTVDATEIAALKPASLESLPEITTSSPEIAYTVFEHADGRIAFGDLPLTPRACRASGRLPCRAGRSSSSQ